MPKAPRQVTTIPNAGEIAALLAVSPRSRDKADETHCVYLLHFEAEGKTKLHYCGVTTEQRLAARMREHQIGLGAALTCSLINQGIGFYLARLWRGEGYEKEKRIKGSGHIKQACPLCGHREPVLFARAFWFDAMPDRSVFKPLDIRHPTSNARKVRAQ